MENTNAETITREDFIASVLNKYEPPKTEIPKEASLPQEVESLPVQTPVAELPKVEEPIQQPTVLTDFSKRLKHLIQDGLIDNFSINYGDTEVFLDDIKDLTEEGYSQIIQGWKTEKEKQKKEKYISLDGLDDTTKKLIEIKKAGGDITEVIRENVTAIQNLQQLKDNIDNEKVQIHIIGQELERKGISLKTIQTEIQSLVESGELESRATQILESSLSVHAQAIETRRVEENSRVLQEKEDLKVLRKDLTAYYKEKNIPESLHKVLVDNATKLDSDKISNTDKLYFEAQKDPQKLAELNFYLNSPEEFKKWLTSKHTLQAKIDVLKPAFTVNINNQKKPNIIQSSADDYVNGILNKQQ